jgi:hypothetical protein
MQGNKGIAKTLIIIVVALLITSIGSIFYFINSPEESTDIKISDVEKVFSIDERAGGIQAESILITRSAGNFVRGRLVDSGDGREKDFYLIRIGEVWRVVDITDKPVSCERFARLGFPNVFIQDCHLTFSDAVTLSEIDATLDDFFKSSANINLKIIATVERVERNENGQLVTVNSGGETIQIQLSNNDPSVQEGDLIVTTITPPNTQTPSVSTNKGSTIYQSSNSVIVNEQDKDLFEVAKNPVNTIVNPTNPNPGNTDTTKVYKVNAPKTSAPPSYFYNEYDVDNSFLDIELDGNF